LQNECMCYLFGVKCACRLDVVPMSSGDNRTIVVIDDNDDVRDFLTLILEGEGYKVLPVEEAETALVMIKRLRPALITLDIELPRVDGLQLLESLKTDEDTMSIPVVILSAKRKSLRDFRATKADWIIEKPFDLKDLQLAINTLIP